MPNPNSISNSQPNPQANIWAGLGEDTAHAVTPEENAGKLSKEELAELREIQRRSFERAAKKQAKLAEATAPDKAEIATSDTTPDLPETTTSAQAEVTTDNTTSNPPETITPAKAETTPSNTPPHLNEVLTQIKESSHDNIPEEYRSDFEKLLSSMITDPERRKEAQKEGKLVIKSISVGETPQKDQDQNPEPTPNQNPNKPAESQEPARLSFVDGDDEYKKFEKNPDYLVYGIYASKEHVVVPKKDSLRLFEQLALAPQSNLDSHEAEKLAQVILQSNPNEEAIQTIKTVQESPRYKYNQARAEKTASEARLPKIEAALQLSKSNLASAKKGGPFKRLFNRQEIREEEYRIENLQKVVDRLHNQITKSTSIIEQYEKSTEKSDMSPEQKVA